MSPIEALREAVLAGRSGQFEVSLHALRRMAERNATRRDVALALASATIALHQGVSKWRLEGGCDDDGQPLAVVVVFEGRTLIVTIF